VHRCEPTGLQGSAQFVSPFLIGSCFTGLVSYRTRQPVCTSPSNVMFVSFQDYIIRLMDYTRYMPVHCHEAGERVEWRLDYKYKH
jgi:hypothetical protein